MPQSKQPGVILTLHPPPSLVSLTVLRKMTISLIRGSAHLSSKWCVFAMSEKTLYEIWVWVLHECVLGFGTVLCTADCAGFYCSPWWAQRGSLVNIVQFKVKTNKISYLSVVRIRTMVIRWVQMGEHSPISKWVQDDVSQTRVVQDWERLTTDIQDQHMRVGSTVRKLAGRVGLITVNSFQK